MNDTLEQHIRRLMSGEARGIGPALARGALAAAEPIYRGVTRARNALYDRELLASRRLPRPVISVGNLTTGGTGKTPVGQWLVRQLLSRGHRPCVLLRGYRKPSGAAQSDEEELLRTSLHCPVVANPDRHRGGLDALAGDPSIDAFVMDDGFQHRRLWRDADVVVIDATEPFGYGHVLPRGMLRESCSALARADLVMLTRTDLVDPAMLDGITGVVRRSNGDVPIVCTAHALTTIKGDEWSASLDELSTRGVLVFSGIGNPAAFERSLKMAGVVPAATMRFRDHHDYSAADVAKLVSLARERNATLLLTTEKDWMKLRRLPRAPGSAQGDAPLFAYVEMRLQMTDSEQQRAMTTIEACVANANESGRRVARTTHAIVDR